MSNTDLIGIITVNFGDTIDEVTENNFAQVIYRLQARADVRSMDNEIIDDTLTDIIEKMYEEERGSEAWECLNNEYTAATEEQVKNLAVIRECEATIELIEKFAEIRGWR